MGLLNAIFLGSGVALVALGAARARGPYSRWRSLKETDENLRRYDQWRGSRDSGVRQVTGADVMREELRRQIRVWLTVVVVGFVLVFLAFAVPG
jgi:hypothetical protein